jgi:uncharacterized protein CbrC (UPF0167 family)
MSLDDTTHCLLCGTRTEKSLMLSTDMRTVNELTLNLLTTTIVAPPSNASKWQMGFHSAFKGLMETVTANVTSWTVFI